MLAVQGCQFREVKRVIGEAMTGSMGNSVMVVYPRMELSGYGPPLQQPPRPLPYGNAMDRDVTGKDLPPSYPQQQQQQQYLPPPPIFIDATGTLPTFNYTVPMATVVYDASATEFQGAQCYAPGELDSWMMKQ